MQQSPSEALLKGMKAGAWLEVFGDGSRSNLLTIIPQSFSALLDPDYLIRYSITA